MAADLETKTCRICSRRLRLEEFYPHRSTRDRRANECKSCQREKTRAWRERNPGTTVNYQRTYRSSTSGREVRRKVRRDAQLRQYGLTEAAYDEMAAAQGNLCAICGRPERFIDPRTGLPRKLAVDHDHATGAVRGLLCGTCNRMLGQIEDDPVVLERAAAYLRSSETADGC